MITDGRIWSSTLIQRKKAKIDVILYQLIKEVKTTIARPKWRCYAPIVKISQSKIPNAHLLI